MTLPASLDPNGTHGNLCPCCLCVEYFAARAQGPDIATEWERNELEHRRQCTLIMHGLDISEGTKP